MSGLAALLVPALVLLSAPLGAQQQVRGLVTEDGTGAPIEGAMILLIDLDGNRVDGVLSASDSRFRIPVPDPGRYVLRVERIGYASMDTDPLEVPAGKSVEQRIVSRVRPIQLARLDVRAGRRCEVRPAEGLATATVWEEVRKALASATWTSDRAMYRFEWMRFERTLDRTGRRVLSEQRRYVRRGFGSQAFTAADPRDLAAKGFVEILPGGDWQYSAPDAKVLLSDAFLDTHCFKLTSEERNDTLLIGLVFEPISGRRLTDVAGVLWLEPVTARLRSAEFTHMNLLPGLNEGGGDLTFEIVGEVDRGHPALAQLALDGVPALEGGVEADYRIWSVQAPKMRLRAVNREQIRLGMDQYDGHNVSQLRRMPVRHVIASFVWGLLPFRPRTPLVQSNGLETASVHLESRRQACL